MIICSIGRPFAHSAVRQIEFNSTETALDFDAVILDPRGINQQELPDLKKRDFG